MPQQQQGFGGGFNPMQQQGFGGFGGGFQPSRQRFNPMQQQQGYGGQMQGFGGQMQGFGGGFGMPQQQGFGGGYGMLQQRQQDTGAQEAYNQFMQQRRQQGDQTLALNTQLQAAGKRGMLGYSPEQMQQSLAAPAPQQQDFSQSQAASQAAALQSMGMRQSEGGYDADMGAYNQASAERNMAARAEQANQPPASMETLASTLRGMAGGQLQQNPMQQQGMNPMQLTEFGRQLPNGGRMDMSQQPSQQQLDMYNNRMRTAMDNTLQQYGGDQSNPAYQAQMQAQDQQMRSQFGLPQSVAAQPGGNLAGGGQQSPMDQMQRYQQMMQQMGQRAAMPGNPYAQQISQEDPRMQMMRNMQRMRFGGF